MSEAVDQSKRRFLIGMTTATGAVGAVGIAVPFVKSMLPSARAEAAGAPVEADISKLQPGEMLTVEWRKKPVWIVKRTEENLADLEKLEPKLADPGSELSRQPEYAKNNIRARDKHKNILVVEGICTHLGCSPKHRPEMAPADLGADWLGGFFCPCHGSKFDLAGRVYSGVPAPLNLPVPPYKYLNDTTILVGDDSKETA
ncbi:MAG: ubiquinol-cytochrome c reductase iron-sulfur subunit [Thioalkalispiraceae bacterium]|jgi:ubiquinol-cytochrome c reductase iron-sulfur subunit